MCEEVISKMTLEEAKDIQPGHYVEYMKLPRMVLGKSNRNHNEIGFFLSGLVSVEPIVPFYKCRKIHNPS